MHEAFDALVRAADSAMVIVTTAAGDERSGCLVGFHSQSSIDPPQYAVWISRANHTFGLASRATTFAVHLVPTDRRDLAELFGGRTGDEVDKLDRCAWTPGPDRVPLLDAGPDRFVGHKVEWIDGDGDHGLLVLEPIDATPPADGPWLHLRDVLDITPGHEPNE